MRAVLKAIAEVLATVVVLPFFVLYRMQAAISAPVRAFPGWSQAFSLLPGLTGVYLRRAFYRLALKRCGRDAFVGFGTILSHPTSSIGRTVYVGAFCCLGDVTLEDDVLLGSRISIANGSRQHGIDRLDVPIREQPGEWPHVTIGADTWIGEGAVVLADVGQHCVVGAGAVVIDPIPDYAVAAGVPAKVIRYRNRGPAHQNDGGAAVQAPSSQ